MKAEDFDELIEVIYTMIKNRNALMSTRMAEEERDRIAALREKLVDK